MHAVGLVRRLAGAPSAGLCRSASLIRRWQVWQLGEPLRAFVLAFPVAAIAFIGLTAADTQWRAYHLITLAALIACGAVAIEATRSVKEVQGTVSRDLQTVWYLTIAIALPPIYALIAPVPLGAYKLLRVRTGFVYRRVFSNAAIALAYGGASAAFHAFPPALAGDRPGAGTHVLTWTAAVAGCGMLAWLINNAPLAVAIRLSDPTARIRSALATSETITSDLVELSMAVSLALIVVINPALMVLALPSIVMYRRYLLHAQLVSQARIDPKTGLLNAATWRHEADAELSRAVRTRTPLAVAMIDLDYFKKVNDTFGHLAGDVVLRDLAGTLQRSVRDYDLVGRFGGEEFTLLLPHTDPDEATQVAERIRDQVSRQVIVIDDGHGGLELRVTVSVGVAALTGSRRDLNELIAAADNALYKAKNAGRNRVHVLGDVGQALPQQRSDAAVDDLGTPL